MGSFILDLKHGLRVLGARAGLRAVMAVVTLASASAQRRRSSPSSTACMLKPLPFRAPGDWCRCSRPTRAATSSPPRRRLILDMRARTRRSPKSPAMRDDSRNRRLSDGDPEQLSGRRRVGEFLLAARRAARARHRLLPRRRLPGHPRRDIVLTDALWRARFGAMSRNHRPHRPPRRISGTRSSASCARPLRLPGGSQRAYMPLGASPGCTRLPTRALAARAPEAGRVVGASARRPRTRSRMHFGQEYPERTKGWGIRLSSTLQDRPRRADRWRAPSGSCGRR